MISIFNGRERTLGGVTSEVFAQVSVQFREYLYILKGARLSVFLAISLHANASGWAWPSRRLLARETGYNTDTVTRALSELCRISINGQRLLLRYQRRSKGTFDHNRYLIFPSSAEIAQYEYIQPELMQFELQPYSGFPVTEKPVTEKPVTEKPVTENHCTKNNHEEGEPKREEETAASKPPAATCSIHNVPMTQREKDGDTWYSHQTEEGVWCRGAQDDQPESDNLRTSAAQRQRYLEWNRHRYIEGEHGDLIQH